MSAATELDGGAELHDAHFVAVFLAEEGHCAELAGFFDGHCSLFFEGYVGTYFLVYETFDLREFLVGDLLEVAEVEA